MRMRSLVEHLGMPVAVSVRGGRAAVRAAVSMGLRVIRKRARIDRADLLIVDDPNVKYGRPWIERARRAGVATVSVHDDVDALDADVVLCGSIAVGTFRTSGVVLN